MAADRCHSECKYHGFLGLVEWCRHPDHLGPLEPGRRLAIEASAGKCANYVDFEAKVMTGEEPRWPMPVDLLEVFPREREKTGFCTHGAQK